MRRLLAALPFLFVAGAASAQELSVEAAVVSDYRYRGYSLSDEQPALQGGATLSAENGFYAGVWGSTIDEYGLDAGGEGATVEVDLMVGRVFSLGAYEVDAGLVAYTYPGGENVNYLEIPLSVSRAAGDWTWTVGGAYAPKQDNLGDDDNAYVFGAVELAPEAWPLAFQASLGWEDGAFGDEKLDWSVGASRAFGPVTLSAQYVDADAPGADAALVGSIGVSF